MSPLNRTSFVVAARSANQEDECIMALGIAVLWLVWLAITRSFELPLVLLGLACSTAAALFWRRVLVQPPSSMSKVARRPLRLLRFMVALLSRFINSTLRTTWIILRGREEGRIMALPIRVMDPLAQFILLNSITLTPSTISLLVDGDILYIHWLQTRGGHGDWREIKESLESRLEALFEGDGHDDH